MSILFNVDNFSSKVQLDVYQEIKATLLDRDANKAFSKQLWRTVCQAGFFTSCINQSGQLSLKNLCNKLTEFSEKTLDIPFAVSLVAQAVGIDMLLRYGSDLQKERYINHALNGDLIIAVANAERASGTDIRAMQSTILSFTDNVYTACIAKPCITNLGDADLAFCSVWDAISHRRPFIEVLLLERFDFDQGILNKELEGFHTGLTGYLKAENYTFNAARFMGERRRGIDILNTSFNIERLAIGSIMQGILAHCYKQSMSILQDRKSYSQPLTEHQYVQDKVLKIYENLMRFQSLIYFITNSSDCLTSVELAAYNKELALLRMMIIDVAKDSLMIFYELIGHRGYFKINIINKLIRDQQALYFLGGSREQQKLSLFNIIKREYRKYV